MITEIHTMRPFRGTGGLGIIKLDKLAYPDYSKMEITIVGKRIYPIEFDTLGHPVISSQDYAYCRALKKNYDRKGETCLLKVTYEPKAFCIKLEAFNKAKAINEIAKGESLEDFKKLLMLRKQFHFCKKNTESSIRLKRFSVFGRYLLETDGRIYFWYKDEKENKYKRGREVHIPGGKEVCSICGKNFTLQDIREGNFTEDSEACKYHKYCYERFITETELCEASDIIDNVYGDSQPAYDIFTDINGEEQFNRYCYHTEQGDISIKFENGIISIKWEDNFKPFNFEKIFKDEAIIKLNKGIKVRTKDEAIHFLGKVKRA